MRHLIGLTVLALALAACGAGSLSSVAPVGDGQEQTPKPTPEIFSAPSGADSFAGDYFQIATAAVAIDYTATGTCSFGVRLFAEASEADNVDTPQVDVAGAADGTWHVNVKPGRYAIGLGGDGCTWSLVVRQDRD